MEEKYSRLELRCDFLGTTYNHEFEVVSSRNHLDFISWNILDDFASSKRFVDTFSFASSHIDFDFDLELEMIGVLDLTLVEGQQITEYELKDALMAKGSILYKRQGSVGAFSFSVKSIKQVCLYDRIEEIVYYERFTAPVAIGELSNFEHEIKIQCQLDAEVYAEFEGDFILE